MTTHAAIGVHDDFAACKARVASGAAEHETACLIDVEFQIGRCVKILLRNDFVHNLMRKFFQILYFHIRRMLVGYDDALDGDRFSAVVEEGNLRFRIRSEERIAARMAEPREFLHDAMAVVNWRRHERISFAACETEHHALIARALFMGEACISINALSDVGRLLVDFDDDFRVVGVEAEIVVVVSNIAGHFTGDFLEIDVGLGGDFAGKDDEIGCCKRFAGDARFRILREQSVENGIGNLVADFVRMAFGNGL